MGRVNTLNSAKKMTVKELKEAFEVDKHPKSLYCQLRGKVVCMKDPKGMLILCDERRVKHQAVIYK